MGFQDMHEIDNGLESENRNWVVAGINLRAPLKPIFTMRNEDKENHNGGGGGGDECLTTPTSEEARIPTRMTCPPAPRKRKAGLKFHCNGVKEFFTPPDLESVFICHVERAN